MTFKVSVDPAKCRSYGVCVDLSEDVFVLDRVGQAHVTAEADPDVPEAWRQVAREAAERCPVGAISIDDGSGLDDAS